MVLLINRNLKSEKLLLTQMTTFFGIGLKSSILLLNKFGLTKDCKVKDLTISQYNNLFKELENLVIDKKLKAVIAENLKRKILMKSYQGLRLVKGYPVRGQRTRSNAKTAKKLNSIRIKDIRFE